MCLTIATGAKYGQMGDYATDSVSEYAHVAGEGLMYNGNQWQFNAVER